MIDEFDLDQDGEISEAEFVSLSWPSASRATFSLDRDNDGRSGKPVVYQHSCRHATVAVIVLAQSRWCPTALH
jgi:hypothetical protein